MSLTRRGPWRPAERGHWGSCSPPAGRAPAAEAGAGAATKNEYVVAPLLGELNALVTSTTRGQAMADFLKRRPAWARGPRARRLRRDADRPARRHHRLRLPAGGALPAGAGRERARRPCSARCARAPTRALAGVQRDHRRARGQRLNAVGDLQGKSILASDPSDAAGCCPRAPQEERGRSHEGRPGAVPQQRGRPGAAPGQAGDAFAAPRPGARRGAQGRRGRARTLKILATVDNAPLEVVAAQGLDGKVLEQFRTAFKGLGDASRATHTGTARPSRSWPSGASWAGRGQGRGLRRS